MSIQNQDWFKFSPIDLLAISLFTISLIGFSSSSFADAKTNYQKSADSALLLNLDWAIKKAQANDPWLVGNRHSQDALQSMSEAAISLPDPKVSIGLANIAADSFDFNQEAMSQIKIGYSQMFPRGDSLALKQQQLKQMSEQFPFQREDRLHKIGVIVSQLWLDAFKAQQSIQLIQKNRFLFEQLADVAQASYSSALAKTRQQDIIRSQLELSRLDDRLFQLQQSKDMNLQKLLEWIGDDFITIDPLLAGQFSGNTSYHLSETLPEIKLVSAELIESNQFENNAKFFEYFLTHPSVMAIEKKMKATQSEIAIAKQSYKPEWGVNAGYAYRDSDLMGNERADLFSIGVSFDLPLFTSNKQDKQLQSAISNSAAVKTEKWLLLRNLMASFTTQKVHLEKLKEREQLYQSRLLPQMHDQAEASLTAYTNDDGDFSEVVRARIAELNALIELLNIQVDIQKTIVQLNYFLAGSNRNNLNLNNFNQNNLNQKQTDKNYTNQINTSGENHNE